MIETDKFDKIEIESPVSGLELLKEIIYHLHQDLKFGVAGFSYPLTNILI